MKNSEKLGSRIDMGVPRSIHPGTAYAVVCTVGPEAHIAGRKLLESMPNPECVLICALDLRHMLTTSGGDVCRIRLPVLPGFPDRKLVASLVTVRPFAPQLHRFSIPFRSPNGHPATIRRIGIRNLTATMDQRPPAKLT